MGDDELYTIALTKIQGLGHVGAYNLIRTLGSAKAVFDNRNNLADMFKGISSKLIAALDSSEAFRLAEKELQFAQKNNIECYTINSEFYPSRLRNCDDAPAVLFFKGKCDLNSTHFISVVGTRNVTHYGEDICQRFISDLSQRIPDVVIVSGLAYGVDILAHRNALKNNLSTVAVLAHGLDRIYPSAHRNTAIEMIESGGLLTEFLSGTNPDKQNFIKRNRIVAGMSDGLVIVQSALKGGALITADIADSYSRDCFAFPGNVNDEYSKGCNKLIRDNKAVLVNGADDVIQSLGWENESKQVSKEIQRELFPELTDDERRIAEILRLNDQGMQINRIIVESDIPVNRLTAILFELEMKGVVRSLAGGVFKFIY